MQALEKVSFKREKAVACVAVKSAGSSSNSRFLVAYYRGGRAQRESSAAVVVERQRAKIVSQELLDETLAVKLTQRGIMAKV